MLEIATKVDQYVDYAQFCRDLHDRDKGRRYKQLAGLHAHVPGEDDLCHFRSRISDAVIDQITNVAVDQWLGISSRQRIYFHTADYHCVPAITRWNGMDRTLCGVRGHAP